MGLESLDYEQLLQRAKNQASELRRTQSVRSELQSAQWEIEGLKRLPPKHVQTAQRHKAAYAKLLDELAVAKAEQTPIVVVGPKTEALQYELKQLKATRRPLWYVIYSWIWGEGK